MLQRPNPGTPQHVGCCTALRGEREVAPLRRLEVEHGGTGHLELGRPVVGLDEVPQDRGLLVLGDGLEQCLGSTAS
jgi:hypothetical protein